MRKLLWVIALIIVLFAGDRIGAWVLKRMTQSSQFRYSRLYRGEANADVLLVGNSRGLMYFQPYIEDKTNLSTLNISYNALPIDLAKNLVADHIRINGAPRLMLLDVTMCDRMNNQLIAGFQTYRSFSENLDTLLQSCVPKTYYGGELMQLYRYNSEIFHRALYYSKRIDEDWLLDRIMTDKLRGQVAKAEINNFTIQNYLLDQLVETVQLAQAAGTEVKLLVNPYYPPYLERITNMEQSLQRIEKATGLKVHNYSSAITDNAAFGDYQHLNKYGARLFIDQLIADGVLSE